MLLFRKQENSINSYISRLNEIEDKITEFYDQHNVPVDDPARTKDGDVTYQFITETQSKPAKIEAQFHKETPNASAGSNNAIN